MPIGGRYKKETRMGVIALIVCLIAASPAETKLAERTVLVFDLSVNIPDAPDSFDKRQLLENFTSGGVPTLRLKAVLDSLQAAADDPKITALFLTGNVELSGEGSGFGALREVRRAIDSFRARGKRVVAYGVSLQPRDYYLMSAADEIILNPFGSIDAPGFSVEPLFFADAFQKYGVGVQVTRSGKYKSAVEPFILEKMSPENREQTQKLLNDLWAEFTAAVEKSRKLQSGTFQRLADAHGILTAPVALKNRLVDQSAYYSDAVEVLRKIARVEGQSRKSIPQITLAKYAGRLEKQQRPHFPGSAGRHIALVYAEGTIVDGEGDPGQVGADRLARELRKIRENDNVRAVVLRVNSPGGSAVASELIQHELELMRASKPVIVSLGSVAASGGYWIATASDRTFAEPNTITGSIGVFGLLPNVQRLANDHGITWDSASTGRLSGLFTIARPKTEEELAVVQGLVDELYAKFLERVAGARKLTTEQVNEIAQGRVWSGRDAHRLKLVDELGGLEAALDYAATKGGLASAPKVIEYPEGRGWLQAFSERVSPEEKPLAKADPVTAQFQSLLRELSRLRSLNDPHGAYALLPFSLKVR